MRLKVKGKALKKGDTIGIIAPSEPITPDAEESINASIKLFENLGIKVKFSKHAYNNPTRLRRNCKTQGRRHKYYV